jgi:hypothetical protein
MEGVITIWPRNEWLGGGHRRKRIEHIARKPWPDRDLEPLSDRHPDRTTVGEMDVVVGYDSAEELVLTWRRAE